MEEDNDILVKIVKYDPVKYIIFAIYLSITLFVACRSRVNFVQ